MSDDEIAGEGRIITLMEAAKLLGTSYPTAHRMACSGELKAFRLRNSWRTSTAACEEYVRRGFAEQVRTCRPVEEGQVPERMRSRGSRRYPMRRSRRS